MVFEMSISIFVRGNSSKSRFANAFMVWLAATSTYEGFIISYNFLYFAFPSLSICFNDISSIAPNFKKFDFAFSNII